MCPSLLTKTKRLRPREARHLQRRQVVSCRSVLRTSLLPCDRMVTNLIICSAAKTRVAVSKSLAPPASESEASEDDDEEDDEETPAPNRISRKPPPPPPKHQKPKASSSKAREPIRLDSDIEELIEDGHDSIMDSSEDEDADEVDDLLGEETDH